MREADFTASFAGLPAGSLLRVSADPRALIAESRDLRGAVDIPWVDALIRSAATVTLDDGGLAADVRLRTNAKRVTLADLPLSPRSGPLRLIGKRGEVAIGIRDPGRVLHFAELVTRPLQPRRLRRLARSSGISDLMAPLLGGQATIAVDPVDGSWATRIGLDDPTAFKLLLDRAAGFLPDLASAVGIHDLGVATPAPGERFYALARPKGPAVVFGVADDALVAASEPHRAAGLGSERHHFVPAARGSLVADVDARRLALRLLARRLTGLRALVAPLALARVGDARLTASIDRRGIRARADLLVKLR
jgi:hypothetical protein